MDDSTIPTAGREAPMKFTCFSNLPCDLRLLIWEFCLPPYRDLKLGHTPGNLLSHDPMSNQRPIPLLQICFESRQVALARGSFLPTQGPEGSSGYMKWVDFDIRTVYTFTDSDSLARLHSFPSNIHAIACLWPTEKGIRNIQQCLIERLNRCVSPPARVLYIGLSGIIFDSDGDRGYLCRDSGHPPELCKTCPLYRDSGFTVVGLDDARLPSVLEAAVNARKKGLLEAHFYHRSPSCFLKNLKRYWDTNPKCHDVRRGWEAMASGRTDGDPCSSAELHLPELRPAVIFGKTRQLAFFTREANTRVHERASGLLFSRQDVHPIRGRGSSALFFARVTTPFDCEGVCGGAERMNQSREG
ncbi:hypothetical protein ACJZ2D_010544 [Fusarium nematophilum]